MNRLGRAIAILRRNCKQIDCNYGKTWQVTLNKAIEYITGKAFMLGLHSLHFFLLFGRRLQLGSFRNRLEALERKDFPRISFRSKASKLAANFGQI